MTRTRIARTTADDVTVRGKSVPRELIGHVTFTEMAWLQILGTAPTPGQTAVLDACLVALMEHGLTPSAIATRMVAGSAPGEIQAAVAAGLLGVGSVFVGTAGACAELLDEIAQSPDPAAAARTIAQRHRDAGARVPGFGHPQHRPDDPRTEPILAVSARHGLAGARIAALRLLGAAVDAAWGKHVTINATGAVAAALGDAGVPRAALRGLACLARCAGLVGHAFEELEEPAAEAMWHAAEGAVPYDGDE